MTLYIAVIGTLFFSIISYFGLTLPACIRLIRRKIVGTNRPAIPVWKRRRFA